MRRREPARVEFPRVFAVACSTFSKTLACPTAPSSKFRFSRFKNANPRVRHGWGKPHPYRSFQRVRTIQSVALGGNKAGVGNDAAEFAFVGAVLHSSGEDDIFLDENAADVIGAELQADLADFDSRSEPARLD